MIHDIVTHRANWESAILIAIAQADETNKSYWQHELKAFKDTFPLPKFQQAFLNGEWVCDGTPPEIPGVYPVSCRRENQSGIWYSYWDGTTFGPFRTTKTCAYDFKDGDDTEHAGTDLLAAGSWYRDGAM